MGVQHRFPSVAGGTEALFHSAITGDSIPLVTWENGKSFELEGLKGYVTDYSISQVGPSEVAAAQVAEAHRRGIPICTKGDTYPSWQFGTLPYLPIPYRWQQRYQAMEEHGVDGVMESWSFGYKPNFVSELRAWTSWTNAPPDFTNRTNMAEEYARRRTGIARMAGLVPYGEVARKAPEAKRFGAYREVSWWSRCSGHCDG